MECITLDGSFIFDVHVRVGNLDAAGAKQESCFEQLEMKGDVVLSDST